MYEQLYQYLVQNNKISLPGLGTFELQRKPAQADFASKSFSPPSYSFLFDQDKDNPSKTVFIWLADLLDITEWEAIKKVNDFTFDIKNKMKAGAKVRWRGVGSLNYGLAGEVVFEAEQKEWIYDQPLTAEKVLRENAHHTIRVGEDDKTSVEMTELLNFPEETVVRRSYWKALSLAIGILLVLFLGWHFSENGIKTSSTGNRSKTQTGLPATTYIKLQ